MKRWTLASARVNAGLTQREAAKELKVTQKTLCSWEKGRTFPNPAKIDAICDLYKVTYDEINFFAKESA